MRTPVLPLVDKAETNPMTGSAAFAGPDPRAATLIGSYRVGFA